LQNKLFEPTIFRLLERDKIDTIIEEEKLGLSGLLDNSSMKRIGSLLGADIICIGTVDQGEVVTVQSKFIDVNTGEILSIYLLNLSIDTIPLLSTNHQLPSGSWYSGDYDKDNLYNGFGIIFNKKGLIVEKGKYYKGILMNATYEGNCLNGKGKAVWSNNDSYEGDWKNGFPTGQGTLIWSNGEKKYIGYWKNGKWDGQGTLYGSDGTTVNGIWKNNKSEGKVTMNMPDGTKYIGQFQKFEISGHGIMTWLDGDKYVGGFSHFLREGQGTFYYSDGSKYIGQWHENKYEGFGQLFLAEGDKYSGQWHDGNENGEGMWTYPNGKIRLYGEFQNGEINGQGKLYNPDGSLGYEGEFQNGKPTDNGTWYYK
jgi:hypothetical protein